MEEPGVPDGGENLLLAMDWDDSALVQAWNQSLRLYRGVGGGGEGSCSASSVTKKGAAARDGRGGKKDAARSRSAKAGESEVVEQVSISSASSVVLPQMDACGACNVASLARAPVHGCRRPDTGVRTVAWMHFVRSNGNSTTSSWGHIMHGSCGNSGSSSKSITGSLEQHYRHRICRHRICRRRILPKCRALRSQCSVASAQICTSNNTNGTRRGTRLLCAKDVARGVSCAGRGRSAA